jgi:hypothetical protein
LSNNNNLRPREPFRGQTKKRRTVALTDDAWTAWGEIAGILSCSKQEAMERIARKELSSEEYKKISSYLLTSSI